MIFGFFQKGEKAKVEKKLRIGIDIGGTNIKIGLVNEEQQLVAMKEIPTRAERPAEELIAGLADEVKLFLKEQGMTTEMCSSAGVGMPGMVDKKNGIVRYSNNIPWEQVPLAQLLSEKLSLPVQIANDADCAALGEVAAGAAKNCENAIMITLGTGVGGGVILDGKIFEGRIGGGCELGHMVIVKNGVQCTCGRRGCLESYASATALKRISKEAFGRDINPKELFELADAGDVTAKNVIAEYIENLAIGIINIVNIFRPEMVLLGGGISRQGEKLLAPIRKKMEEESFGGIYGELPQLKIAVLENDAGMIGAANL